MAIISLICPMCGASLTVESDRETAYCAFCGRPYLVKEEITRNYVNNYTTIHAGTVNLSSEKEFIIKAGRLFRYEGEAVDVRVPDTVYHIENEAFAGLGIRSVILPKTVKTIGERAFCSCKDLEYVNIPEGVAVIPRLAFNDCYSLQEVVIPHSVQVIGERAFRNCRSLQQIFIPEGVCEIPELAFQGCCSLRDIRLPNSVCSIGDSAFHDCRSLQEIILPEYVAFIRPMTFYGCTGLKRVKIPAGVEGIGLAAFQGCTQLEKVNFPSSVSLVSSDAFHDCWKLRNVRLKRKVAWIESKEAARINMKIRVNNLPANKMIIVNDAFINTAYFWMKAGLCAHCGKKFTGLHKKTCICCGAPKDY